MKNQEGRLKTIVAVLAVAFAVMFAPRADAAVMFGEQDNFKTLAKLSIPADVIAANDLPKEWAGNVELTEHSTTLFILAGVYVSDKGYAIKPLTGDSYWDVTDEQAKILSEAGILPNPLPPHEMDMVDLIFGYSLWIVIAGVVLFYGAKALFFKKPAAAAAAAVPPAEPPGGGR